MEPANYTLALDLDRTVVTAHSIAPAFKFTSTPYKVFLSVRVELAGRIVMQTQLGTDIAGALPAIGGLEPATEYACRLEFFIDASYCPTRCIGVLTLKVTTKPE